MSLGVPGPTPFVGHSRRRAWERLSRGLYAPSGRRTLAQELHAWQLVLPRTSAFSHLTAAELLGWWLPAPIVHPIFAAIPADEPRPRRSGLFVCRHPEPVAMNVRDGLRVTTAAETLLAAARDLGILDLVIMADSALRMGHCTLTDLVITARQRRRGGPLLRSVIPLLDKRSESPWESIMRVLHVAAEIPVEPQYEIVDQWGRFVARVDLWLKGTSRVNEYDGEVHGNPDVRADDLRREGEILRAGYERRGFMSRHLINDAASIIADADRLLGRPWDPRRLEAWRALLENSLYGRVGRARAYRQWRRASS